MTARSLGFLLVGLGTLIVLAVVIARRDRVATRPVQAALGGDLRTQLTHAAAGGGTIGGVLMWAARLGFFAAVNIGLGGRFGGEQPRQGHAQHPRAARLQKRSATPPFARPQFRSVNR